MKKCINEYYIVCNENTQIMVAEFDDGSIEKEFEYYVINKNAVEFIQHCNRDRSGNSYTTRKIIKPSVIFWERWYKDVEYYKNRKGGKIND